MRSKEGGMSLPTLTATNSTGDSLSWSLLPGEGSQVEMVQISCWEGGARPAVDPPCCRTELRQRAPGEATLVIRHLRPGTQYSCQGGMLVSGQWLFSPKASRITQPRQARSAGNTLLSSPHLLLIL